LSITPANTPHLQAVGLTPVLVASVRDTPVTGRSLTLLYNLVAPYPEGRRAMNRVPNAVPSLVDMLN
jgi:hypothetical protein